uniref:ATP-grasp domain-containing protein n=1 Tax=Ditylum brightwellii TaxID=49249 RepID=A0A7S2EA59_9STRA
MTVKTKNGKVRPLHIIQTTWCDLVVGSTDNYSRDPKHRCQCSIKQTWKWNKAIKPADERMLVRCVFPELVLSRNEVSVPNSCNRNKLLGLMYANVPMINSGKSILLNCDRPIMMSYLKRAADKCEPKPIPVIPQQFFCSPQSFFYAQKFPAVVKYDNGHAGVGKIKVSDHKMMEDAKSILPIVKHATAEIFINGECDLRLQMIGNNMRMMKRISVSGDWKTNTGCSILEDIPKDDKNYKNYEHWLKAASTMFGEGEEDRMDILTLDFIVERETEKMWCLELNGSSSGLNTSDEKTVIEDNGHIANLVLDRIAKL